MKTACRSALFCCTRWDGWRHDKGMTHLAACIARQLPALAEHRTDGELLAAFLADRDEPAFAELVRRHAPAGR